MKSKPVPAIVPERASGVELTSDRSPENMTDIVTVARRIAMERAAVLRRLRAALLAGQDALALDLARVITGLRDDVHHPPR